MKHRLKDLQHKKLQQNNLKTRRIEKPQPLKAQSLKNVYMNSYIWTETTSETQRETRNANGGRNNDRLGSQTTIWVAENELGFNLKPKIHFPLSQYSMAFLFHTLW